MCTFARMLKEEQDLLIEQGKLFPIMEEFYTIQGEGFYTGTASYFIRIGGCDVGCPWCDVKESWDADIHKLILVDNLVEKVKNKSNIAIITGGEPLMWNLDYLTSELQKNGIRTHIETSGSSEFSGHWDWFCLSPKKRKLPTERCYKEADELKIVVLNENDFKFAEKQAEKVTEKCRLYLQPEWSKGEKMIPLIAEYVKRNPKWRISLQTHKYLDIP